MNSKVCFRFLPNFWSYTIRKQTNKKKKQGRSLEGFITCTVTYRIVGKFCGCKISWKFALEKFFMVLIFVLAQTQQLTNFLLYSTMRSFSTCMVTTIHGVFFDSQIVAHTLRSSTGSMETVTLLTLTVLDATQHDSKESLKGHSKQLWVLTIIMNPVPWEVLGAPSNLARY